MTHEDRWRAGLHDLVLGEDELARPLTAEEVDAIRDRDASARNPARTWAVEDRRRLLATLDAARALVRTPETLDVERKGDLEAAWDAGYQRGRAEARKPRGHLRVATPTPPEGLRCPDCRESASGVCTMHNGSSAASPAPDPSISRTPGDDMTESQDVLADWELSYEDWLPIDGAWHHIVIHVPKRFAHWDRALSEEEVLDRYRHSLPRVHVDGVRVIAASEAKLEPSR